MVSRFYFNDLLKWKKRLSWKIANVMELIIIVYIIIKTVYSLNSQSKNNI